MGPHGVTPLSEAGGWADDVARMLAFLERHPEVTWLRPVRADDTLAPGLMQRATWEESGTTVTAEREHLGHLVDYLKDRFEHEIVIVPTSAYSVTGRNSGRPANLSMPWDYPAEALCSACGQTVSCEELTGRHPDWKHTGRRPGET